MYVLRSTTYFANKMRPQREETRPKTKAGEETEVKKLIT